MGFFKNEMFIIQSRNHTIKKIPIEIPIEGIYPVLQTNFDGDFDGDFPSPNFFYKKIKIKLKKNIWGLHM